MLYNLQLGQVFIVPLGETQALVESGHVASLLLEQALQVGALLDQRAHLLRHVTLLASQLFVGLRQALHLTL